MKVKEVLIVEGKHDSEKLKSCITCDTIETNGTHLGKEKLALIKKVQKQRGIIIFTDPDVPGEKIRHAINTAVPGCKNAFIEKKKAKTTKKVGVEHATKEDILEALQHLMSYEEHPALSISWVEFLTLGLTGCPDSQHVRELLGHALFIGRCNAKTLWKRLNMLGLTRDDVAQLLTEIGDADKRDR